MSAAQAFPDDPVRLVNQLDPEAIRNRLDELDRERDALYVLLRAALRARRTPTPDGREAQRAS